MASDGTWQRERTWHTAAEAADFVPFEAFSTSGDERWAGGFGGEPGRTGHLEVISLIDAVEVEVDTHRWARRLDVDLTRTMLVYDLVSRFVMAQATIELPFTTTVVPDDRVLEVDGTPVTFQGARVDGQEAWAGWAEHDGALLSVRVAAAVVFAIRRCTDWAALPEHRPGLV